MTLSLKPLDQQVIVITGASSGIGLATALAAARAGAKVVLAARSGETLDSMVREIVERGGTALGVDTDVTERAQLQHLAERTLAEFGRFDTWVNNAGLSIYGRLDQVDEADSRRLFDVNFWGVVNASLIALRHLKKHGGALINVGSEVSDAIIPFQGMYSASKHAVKGFTDALRVEVEQLDRAPVAVTLIQPTAVDTPFPQHARNYMSREPKLPTPQIAPERVAEAILKAATRHTREIKVGTLAKVNVAMAKRVPRIADKIAEKQASRQEYDEPPRNPQGTLYRAGGGGRTRGVKPEEHAKH